jgi:hypothetical protein
VHSDVARVRVARVSTEGFFDQVARTLAEPMPRRRAVRVLGASLAALAVPGVSPRSALALSSRGSGASLVCAGTQICKRYKDPNNWAKGQEEKCCPYPADQWRCGSDGWTCVDTCAASKKVLPKGKWTEPSYSTERRGGDDPDLRARPKRYRCCVRPDTIPKDGECLPNCPYQYRFGGAIGPISCGETCCATYQVCVNGKCRPCEDFGGHSCQPYGTGATICCAKGTNCCANKTSTACCGPQQTCKAAGRKTATCVCEEGTKCGTDCCKKGEICTGSECCAANRLCPTGQTTNTCCSGENEYCFFKADPDLVPLGKTKLRAIGICKEGCAPRNIAGRQCCGTGFKPNRDKTRCVPQ